MTRIAPLLLLVGCTLSLGACFAGLGSSREQTETRADAGPDPHTDAGPDTAFPYRWKANGPGDGAPLGGASFRLTCLEASGRERDDCSFTCSHEALDAPVQRYECGPRAVAEACAGEYVARDAPGQNRVCISTLKPPSDTGDYDAIEHTECWEWSASAFPYRVATPEIDPRYTALSVPLSCERKTVSSDGTPIPLCAFECSLDRRPYEPCNDGFVREQVGPGPHELRVRMGAYLGKSLRMSPDAPSAFSFRIADDAAPALVLPELPAARAEAELAPFARLFDPYTAYALVCAGIEAEVGRAGIVQYASAALARGAELDGELVETCRDVLKLVAESAEPERDCLAAIGSEGDLALRDPILPVRLPIDCMMLNYFGAESADGFCFTHAECDLGGPCQPLAADRPLGRCDFGLARGTATLCGVISCDEDDYCKSGVCSPRHPEGSECFDDYECWRGATCEGRRCVRRRCAGQTCTTDSQCQSGACANGKCAPSPADD